MTPQEKFADARSVMTTALIERHAEIDMILTAIVAEEHPLLVGPPGTAKSLLIDSLVDWIDGANKFTILFNKFTTPEEVFGPLSISALKQDRYIRITHGKLPDASLGFGDETFKASSAILNTLLRILNERVYDSGSGLVKIPLKVFIAASNEWPSDDGGKELSALFDRFLFRKTVKQIQGRTGQDRLLWDKDLTPKFNNKITPNELSMASNDAANMPFGKGAKTAIYDILNEIRKESIVVGDRRKRKAIKAVQAYAYVCGHQEVNVNHLDILAHILWEDPIEHPDKVLSIINKIANPQKAKLTNMLAEAEEIIAKTNPKDLGQATTGTAKLSNILKEIQAMNLSADNQLGNEAKQHIKDAMRNIKLANFEEHL